MVITSYCQSACQLTSLPSPLHFPVPLSQTDAISSVFFCRWWWCWVWATGKWGFLCCRLPWVGANARGLWAERLVCPCESAQCSWPVVGTVGNVRSGFSRNLIILNFAILISLFTQPIKFSDGQLVLSCSFQPPLFLIRQYYRRLSF